MTWQAALHHDQHHSTADDKVTASKPRPHLSDCATNLDINKYLYIYVCGTVVVNLTQPCSTSIVRFNKMRCEIWIECV